MSKASPIQTSFNAGELSPRLDGRVDLGKYAAGCKRLENFIPMIQGPALRRSGTRFVNEVKNSANRTWLIRFEFSETQSYILEFGDQYIRFYTNHGQVLSGGSAYEISSPYTAADLTNANGTLKLRFVQSGDVVYFVHPNYAPRKLSRLAPTNWTLTEVVFEGGPFQDIDPDETVTVYASAATGTITLTASGNIFSAADVGSLFLIESEDGGDILPWESQRDFGVATNPLNQRRRSDGKIYICATNYTPPAGETIYTGSTRPTHTSGTFRDGSGTITGTSLDGPIGVDWTYESLDFGYVKITAYTSPTQVTAVVQKRLPFNVVTSSYPSTRWAFSRWSATDGYPTNVAFFRERLVFATGQTIDMSVAADFENFSDRNTSGEVTADMAIAIQVSSDTVNTIEWLSPSDGLLIGTAGGEFVAGEVTTDEPLGPGNVKITQQSLFGSKSVIPQQIGDTILFVQRSGKKMRELQYEFSSNGYKSTDLTVLADHISNGGIVDIAYQQEPHSIVWAARTDGILLGFTYNREQDVLGWHRHVIGGDGIVECVEHIPNPNGTQDDLWMIVRRTINGQTKRYIEYLEEDFTEESALTDAFFVDSGLSYSGAATTTLSGLGHLEGETVQVLVNGAAHPDRVVTSGAITLQVPATTASVGLGYQSTIQTMRIEAGARDGTAQGKTKRINKMVIRFLATVGAIAGPDDNTLDRIQFRSGSDPMDQPVPLFTGDKLMEWPSGYDFDGYIVVKQDQPLPMTVVALMAQLTTQDR
jgi:hypothetical protein